MLLWITNFQYAERPNQIWISTDYSSTEVVQRLVNGKATGIHNIPNKVLKDSTHLIAPVLMDIFNLSISTKIFPDDLKVVPVYKSGERENLNNYRPIAVLPTIARVFEKLLYRQLYSYLMNNQLLDDRQFGFRITLLLLILVSLLTYEHW